MAGDDRGAHRGEPTVMELVLDRIDTVERNLNRRLDEQDRTLGRVEAKVDKTNGRVTTLERARERGLGVVFAFKWLPPILTALVTAGLTILTMALSGGLH